MKEPHLLSHCRPGEECPALEVEGITFLDNGPYSFTVKSGECVGLSGFSGIGKTLLLKAIADLIPHSGTVRCGHLEASQCQAPEWRSKVCMVPAESSWWFDRVEQHLPETMDRDFVLDCLGQLGFPTDVLGWQVSRLSTGERQRLALVRALALQPLVLLLDEPTSGLDSCCTGQAERLLLTYLQTRPAAMVWVSHDLEQFRRVARRFFLVEKNRLVVQAGQTELRTEGIPGRIQKS